MAGPACWAAATPGEHEDAGADDAADAEGDQRRDAERPHQGLVGGLLLVGGDRLGRQHPF